MSFEQVIPKTGQDLIASATAGNSLIIDNVKCSTSNAYSIQTLKQNPSYFTNGTIQWSKTGDIVSTGRLNNANRSTARIISSFAPDGTEYNGYLFCVFAHTTNESTPVPLCWIYDQSNPLVIPASVITSNIAFNISVRNETAITAVVNNSSFISIPEWERIVSAHSAGTSQSGDDQTIYGEKTFEDLTKMHSLSFTGALNSVVKGLDGTGILVCTQQETGVETTLLRVTSDDHSEEAFCVKCDEGNIITTHLNRLYAGDLSYIYLNSSIYPEEPDVQLGSFSEPFIEASATTLRTEKLASIVNNIEVDTDEHDCAIIPSGTHSLSIGNASNRIGSVNTVSMVTSSITSSNASNGVMISVGALGSHVVVEPYQSNTCFIGTYQKPFNTGYFNSVNASALYLNGTQFQFTNRFPDESGSDSVADVKVGCIVHACGPATEFGVSAGASFKYGDRVNISSSTAHVAKLLGSIYSQGTKYLPEGVYISLCEASFTGTQNTVLVLQRLS